MSARKKVAREAVFDAMIEHGPDGHTDGHDKITDAALAAADSVLFSEAAIERAAKAAVEHLNERGYAEESEPGYVLVDGTYDMSQLVRAVIEELKGGA